MDNADAVAEKIMNAALYTKEENLKEFIAAALQEYGDARVDAMIDEMAASGMDDPISQSIRSAALEEAAKYFESGKMNATGPLEVARQIRSLMKKGEGK